jgi:hypothetical protein
MPSHFPGQLDLPFHIRGMHLSLRVTRMGGRICFTLFIPTQMIGTIEIAIYIEEAPIRAALERAATSELARAAAGFFRQGNAPALQEVQRGLQELLSPEDVIALAQEAAIPSLWQQAEGALQAYGLPLYGIPNRPGLPWSGWGAGPVAVGGDRMPGYAAAGDYERTFLVGDRGWSTPGPAYHANTYYGR